MKPAPHIPPTSEGGSHETQSSELRSSAALPSSEELARTYLAADTMRAVGLTEKPGVSRVCDGLKMLEVGIPRPSARQIAIRLCASSMHVDEIYAAQGTCLGRFFGPKTVSAETPYILGSSVSGIVVDCGEDVHAFHVGDEVIAIPNAMGENASWADYRCVEQKHVMHKPKELSHVEAAAVTLSACVAWSAVLAAKVTRGSRCVVVGASGATGIMALQYLKSLGCHVTAICSAANEQLVRARGADQVIDYTKHDFGALLREREDRQDAVIDCVGGRDTESSGFQALKTSGRFVTVVGPKKYVGEQKLSRWQFSKVLLHIGKRYLGTRFRGQRYLFGGTLPRRIIDAALKQVIDHDIRMPVQDVIPFEITSVIDAVRLLTTHRAKGRIVIDFSSEQPGQ